MGRSKITPNSDFGEDPWDIDQIETSEVVPVFGRDRDVRLSELDISSSADAYFALGQAIAHLHKIGLITTDMHPGNLSLSPTSGGWNQFDWGDFYHADIHPENMGQHFVELFAQYDEGQFLAITSGYAQQAYQVIDPEYPGFTDALLELLFEGQILSRPKPREKVLHVEQIMSAFGLTAAFGNDQPHITIMEPSQSIRPPVNIGLVPVIASLSLGGFDASNLLHFAEQL